MNKFNKNMSAGLQYDCILIKVNDIGKYNFYLDEWFERVSYITVLDYMYRMYTNLILYTNRLYCFNICIV